MARPTENLAAQPKHREAPGEPRMFPTMVQLLLVAAFIGNRIRPVGYDSLLLPALATLCIAETLHLWIKKGRE